MADRLRAYLELAKIRITVLATVTAAVGYGLGAERIGWEILIPVLGLFLLGCGSATLNQMQERDVDAKMERTKARPLPTGRVSLIEAGAFAAAMIGAGAAILSLRGPVVVALGVLALLWYNVVYTPLKRVTAFAVVPGALIGAIPPVVGWAAAGRGPLEAPILALAFFLFVWQVPHFWLILLYVGKDYERAGLPSMHQVFSSRQLTRITFVWILATASAALAMPLFGLGRGAVLLVFLAISTVWLVRHAVPLLRPAEGPKPFRGLFLRINLYALLVLVGLTVDKLVPLR